MSGSNHRRDDRRRGADSNDPGGKGQRTPHGRRSDGRGDAPRRDRDQKPSRQPREGSAGRDSGRFGGRGDKRDDTRGSRSRDSGQDSRRSREENDKPEHGRADNRRRSTAREGDRGKRFGRGDKPRSYDRKDRADQRGPSRGAGRTQENRSGDRKKTADADVERNRRAPDRGGRRSHDDRSGANARQRDSEQQTTATGTAEPTLPEGAVAAELHGEVRRELRSLPKGLAEKVAAHLVAAGSLVDSDPREALSHARFARQRASRIGVVREANGITAYEAGEWNEALAELRAARRMGGSSEHLAIMADCERALGRPERALDLSRSAEAAELAGQEAVELRIVAAGARRDLGEIDASIVSLQTKELDPQRQDPWSARLFYAYADNLLAADRVQEAFTWFVHAAHADDEGETDAPERLDQLVESLGGTEAAEEIVADAETSDAEPGEDQSEGDSRPGAGAQ